jgi:4-hydroxythreonine-4-phosphate dehydrogenase
MLTEQPIGITMGCPVGIGPEIICRFFSETKGEAGAYIVLGDRGVSQNIAALLGLELLLSDWHPGAPVQPGTLPVLEVGKLDPATLHWGHPNRSTGQAMAEYITQAVKLCLNGSLAAMVTCPIGKVSLNAAGYAFPGHTEMLADLTGTSHYRMMMHGKRLNVVLVTIHQPLARVPGSLHRAEIEDCIEMTIHALRRDFGVPNPRVAVAALNPHAGEEGMFGGEEKELIQPAIASCGQGVSGPWPPDTVFHQAAQGDFDAVIAMYHDQGLIPFKLLHFKDGVNVTLGLPIVRTSVDHGTAYDIAGQGVADHSSLSAACRAAWRIAKNRNRLHL